MTSIVYKSDDFAIVYKPAGTPSQPDNSKDADALTECAAALSVDVRDVYLVHRLDRVVGGLMVIARNSRCAAEFSAAFSDCGVMKEYLLITEGAPEHSRGKFVDYLKKDAVLGRSVVLPKGRDGGKFAELDYEVIDSVNESGRTLTLIRVHLLTGRFHQIRAQFSSRGLPLVGDGKYGSKFKRVRVPMLFSSGLSFTIGGKEHTYKLLPNSNEYPWSLFDFSKLDT